MKMNPEIIAIRKSIDFDFESLDSPTLRHKGSLHTYDSDAADRANATFATLNSPLNLQEVQEISFKKQAKQCRICLQNSIQNSQQLLSLCKCSGSVQFIHQKCFKQWVQKSLKSKKANEKKKIMQNKQIECEMCKQKISVTFQETFKLKNCNSIHESIKNRPKIFGFILATSLVGLIIMIYVISMIGVKGISFDQQKDSFLQSILEITSLVLLFLLVCITVGYIVEQYFIEEEICIGKIMSKKQFVLENKRKSSFLSGESLSPYQSPFKERKTRIKKQVKSSLGHIIQEYPQNLIKVKPREQQIKSQFKLKRVAQNEQEHVQ